MKSRIIISKDNKEHESNMDSFLTKIGETDKLMIFHKIVRASKGGFTFLSFVHYTLKNDKK